MKMKKEKKMDKDRMKGKEDMKERKRKMMEKERMK